MEKYCKNELDEYDEKPANIPANPYHVYRDNGWVSYGDWLGNDNVATRKLNYMSFKKAKTIVKELNLSSSKEWLKM